MASDPLLHSISDDNDSLMLAKYQGGAGLCIASGCCALLVVGIIALAAVDPSCSFLRWGPSDDVSFAGIRINTWSRWGMVMSYSLCSQIAQSLVYASLSPWISNVVRDHKTHVPRQRYAHVQAICLAYNSFGWLISILDTFVWITCQFQYLAPALLGDVAISIWTTHMYVSRKK